MARKDVFANINSSHSSGNERRATPGYAMRGASRSMVSSLHEMAEKAARADMSNEGEAVVELDTAVVHSSFVSDRLRGGETAYIELREAIKERGQDTPIKVRPHPDRTGEYQVIFGHRRLRAAVELGRPVLAIIKDASDVDHVIAQGQENAAREDLSFIERAVFAQKLLDLGHDRSVILMALSVDAPMLTRMLSVTSRIAAPVIDAIGAAKGVGRDRWIDLAQQVEVPTLRTLVEELISSKAFDGLPPDARFDYVAREVKKAARPARRKDSGAGWQAGDGSVRAEFKGAGKSYSIALKANDAARFGRFIAENLERLHAEFVTSTKTEES